MPQPDPRPDPNADEAPPKLPDRHERVRIEAIWPEIDGGLYPVKRIMGDEMVVEADLLADGHDEVAGIVGYRHESEERWTEVPLLPTHNDRFRASFVLDRLGRYYYRAEAWIDAFASWRHGLAKKADAGVDVHVDLLIGRELVLAAAERAEDPTALTKAASWIGSEDRSTLERVNAALDPELEALMRRHPDRRAATLYPRELAITVDRERARFSTWYEFFPRSFGRNGAHGTFADAASMLPYIAKMGFDVVYLPPIHPIGKTKRKGRNNALSTTPRDPGSPWAVGGSEGGHTAIHPELGTFEDFARFCGVAREHDLEVAIDVAFQASPDHPWVKEHPEWFRTRPDGSIQYAENPPKKYEDIYPLDFDSENWRALWNELLGVFLFWIERDIRIFRVDNPHTKSLAFWQWCIETIKRSHPDVIFLSEAFTRPKLMYALAKV
ncbi:MAG TPA: maltotransferase domain-containing protein, partial [Polyangiaceae bacterium]|nr:maltotransferase domain-containing protein [Polyangiaceae bacterium]